MELRTAPSWPSAEQILTLRRSSVRLTTACGLVSEAFYASLFGANPVQRPLFFTHMLEQPGAQIFSTIPKCGLFCVHISPCEQGGRTLLSVRGVRQQSVRTEQSYELRSLAAQAGGEGRLGSPRQHGKK